MSGLKYKYIIYLDGTHSNARPVKPRKITEEN